MSSDIMNDSKQVLYAQCTAKWPGGLQCSVPVFDVIHERPLCDEHARKKVWTMDSTSDKTSQNIITVRIQTPWTLWFDFDISHCVATNQIQATWNHKLITVTVCGLIFSGVKHSNIS